MNKSTLNFHGTKTRRDGRWTLDCNCAKCNRCHVEARLEGGILIPISGGCAYGGPFTKGFQVWDPETKTYIDDVELEAMDRMRLSKLLPKELDDREKLDAWLAGRGPSSVTGGQFTPRLPMYQGTHRTPPAVKSGAANTILEPKAPEAEEKDLPKGDSCCMRTPL